MKRYLNKTQREILMVLQQNPRMTDREISMRLGEKPSNVRSRRSELLNRNLVFRCSKRKDKETKRLAYTWQAVEPFKLTLKQKVKYYWQKFTQKGVPKNELR